ncbi:MAG: DNA polymerase III subunit alpha, partial [Calditrichia bacterium]
MSNFVHLHVHTEYSLLDGLIKIPDLLDKVEEYGMKSVAITDHGAMYGVYKFYREATNRGIKPIIGMEAYHAASSLYSRPKDKRDHYHLILLAKNNKGYKNLMKLTTTAHLHGHHYKPRVDMKLLSKHAQGLICLTGCLQSRLNDLLIRGLDEKAKIFLEQLMEIFPEDHLYIELQHHPKISEQEKINKKLIELSRTYGVPLVATNDVHYLNSADAEAHELLLCIQTGNTIIEKNRPLSMIESPDFYFRSPQEMNELFLDYPEAIENTVKIAEACNVKIQEGKFILPFFSVPDEKSTEEYLRDKVYENISYIPHSSEKEIKKRIDYELEVICGKGYATYFLIFADFVNWAKEQGILVGPGRGSVAGSLVAYTLRITTINPLEYNIPFERFLNPSRPSPPDIDLDFADDRRDEVIKYVVDKYGSEKIAQIITFGSMEARQSIRDVGRALGMPYSQPDRIARMIPPGHQGFKMTLDNALSESRELQMAYNSEEDTKKLIDLAKKMEGIARHASVHAAGVVIADKILTEYTPLQKEPRGGDKIITQYDMYSLDINAAPDGRAIGLLKMDLLGLRNLTILQTAIENVKQTQGKEVDIANLPLDDTEVYEMISSGETTGIFQIESHGMRDLARKMQPSSFPDIAAMIALFRPGAMNEIDGFVAAKRSPKKTTYLHPKLKPVLEETYGIALYQEQCMQIANVMAGYTMEEADRLRYAIGKKKKKAMRKEKKMFIKGCVEEGHSENLAERLWSIIEKFVGYGFNKPHSFSYAMITYQTAYMKTKYPVEYMAAVLSSESRAASGPARDRKMAQAVKECRRMNIKILPPDINTSLSDFSIDKGRILYGLTAVKNVGSAAVESILTAREKKGKFTDLFDFCQKVNLTKVNRKTLESLIKTGAMDRFGNRSAILSALPKIISRASRIKKRRASGQTSLFESLDFSEKNKASLPEMQEFNKSEILGFEKEYLGLYLTEHPINS